MIPSIEALAYRPASELNRASIDRVVESFEAVFISQLVRGFRESYCKEFWSGTGFGKDIYAGWFDQALSEAIARAGGIGVKGQLQRWILPGTEKGPEVPKGPQNRPRFHGRY